VVLLSEDLLPMLVRKKRSKPKMTREFVIVLRGNLGKVKGDLTSVE